MSSLPAFKRAVSAVMRLWDEGEYDHALAKVEGLLEEWPGNGYLHVLWAGLVQLQDDPKNSLDEAKEALTRAVELDTDSPVGSIELGHFLDAVEDDPQAATKAYASGVTAARRLLIEGLIGQARALRQLDRGREFQECLLELLNVLRFEPGSKASTSEGFKPDIYVGSPTGRVDAIRLTGPYAEQVEELLESIHSNRPA